MCFVRSQWSLLNATNTEHVHCNIQVKTNKKKEVEEKSWSEKLQIAKQVFQVEVSPWCSFAGGGGEAAGGHAVAQVHHRQT